MPLEYSPVRRPTSPLDPASPPLSPLLPRTSADVYQSLAAPPGLANDNRESFAMSSIHSPPPDAASRRFLGASARRDSDATWATRSDDNLPHSGSASPFLKDESRLQSTAVLTKYEDNEQGHAYPRPSQDNTTARAVGNGRRRRRWIVGILAALLLVIAIGVAVGVVLSRRNSSNDTNSSGSDHNGDADSPTKTATGSTAMLWGTGGEITANNGTKFFYNNTFGGTWVAVPFNDTARPQSDQPALNEKWNYGADRMFGVNLGGWLVIEPFIAPGLFEPFENSANPPVDEWHLCQALGTNMATVIEDHYKTFITEGDFAQIAAAGLNWIRLPVAWWMIEVWDGEPFLEGVSFNYFLKAIEWARKYGLRINLDFHTIPGSQNGYNHSGMQGSINFLFGAMGVANAQRALNYIRVLTEFISQPQYSNVVPMFSVLNEALLETIGAQQLRQFYYHAYNMVRDISGIGEGKGPFFTIHDGFGGTNGGHLAWGGFLSGGDRVGLDSHPYLCFSTQSNDSVAYNANKPCSYWATSYNQTMTSFGFNFAGEYSLAINDCGQYLNNVGAGIRFEGTYPTPANPSADYPRVGSCDVWNDYTAWGADIKTGLADMAFASQDAFQNSFFWTWRIGPSTKSKLLPNPFWNYQLGLSQGWIRPDARKSVGGCAVVAGKQGTKVPSQSWAGTLQPWQTGGVGAGTLGADQAASYGQWPPATISGAGGGGTYQGTLLLQYTQTGPVPTLTPTQPVASLFPSGATSTAAGNGWFDSSDKAGWYVSASGCSYPNEFSATGLAQPTAACGGGAVDVNKLKRALPTALPQPKR